MDQNVINALADIRRLDKGKEPLLYSRQEAEDVIDDMIKDAPPPATDDAPEAGALKRVLEIARSITSLHLKVTSGSLLYEKIELLIHAFENYDAMINNVPKAGTDTTEPDADAYRRLWLEEKEVATRLRAEREAHEADQEEATLVVSAAIKSLAIEREDADGLAEKLWNAADDSHNDREHPGDFKDCRVQLCKIDREAVAVHNTRRASEKGADGE